MNERELLARCIEILQKLGRTRAEEAIPASIDDLFLDEALPALHEAGKLGLLPSPQPGD